MAKVSLNDTTAGLIDTVMNVNGLSNQSDDPQMNRVRAAKLKVAVTTSILKDSSK